MTRAQCIVGECTADITLKPTQYISCFYCKIIVGMARPSSENLNIYIYLECFFFTFGAPTGVQGVTIQCVCMSGTSLSKTLSSQINALENPTNIKQSDKCSGKPYKYSLFVFSSNIAAIHQPIPLFSFGVIVFLMIHTCNFVIYITSLILQLLFWLRQEPKESRCPWVCVCVHTCVRPAHYAQ